MNVATGRFEILECFLSSTAANSLKNFCNSCQKGSNAGLFGRSLSFRKSHNKSVSFDSRINLTFPEMAGSIPNLGYASKNYLLMACVEDLGWSFLCHLKFQLDLPGFSQFHRNSFFGKHKHQ